MSDTSLPQDDDTAERLHKAYNRLEQIKHLSEQIVLRDGTKLPADIYALTRKLFLVAHERD